MTEQPAIRIGAERVTTDETHRGRGRPTTATRSARVPACGAGDVDARGRRPREAACAEPLPPWQRAEILDRAAVACSPSARRSSPASSPRRRPSRSRRRGSRPTRAVVDVHVRGGRGPHASPARWCRSTRPTPGEGKLGFTLRVPIGVVGAISPFNFPLNLVAHKVAPAIAAGLPGGAQAGQPDPAVGDRARRPAARRVRAARRAGSTSSPASGGTVGNAIVDAPRHRHDHLHRLARGRLGHPGRARRARRSASSSATTRR